MTSPYDIIERVKTMSTITPVEDFRYRTKTKRTRPWRGIVVHWTGGSGGTDAAIDYTGRAHSGGWYHYICGIEKTVQCIDPDTHSAGHAGAKWNPDYIGVASSHPIAPGFNVGGWKDKAKTAKYTRAEYDAAAQRVLERAVGREYDTELVANGSWARTYPTVLRMCPVHARQVASLCEALCNRHGIPRRVAASMRPKTLSVDGFNGVCFHHQVSTNGKWDCLPWMDVLIPAFEELGFEVVR